MVEVSCERKRKLKKLVVRKPYILFCPDYAAIVVEHKNETVCVAIGSPDDIDNWLEETKGIWVKGTPRLWLTIFRQNDRVASCITLFLALYLLGWV